MHKDVTTTVVGHREGWTLDSINRIFCYTTMNAKGDTICARALSNWPDGTSGGFLSTILCIDEVDRNDFRVFSLSLMGSSLNLFTESTGRALTISILRFNTEFKSGFQNHNLVTRIENWKKLKLYCMTCKINKSHFLILLSTARGSLFPTFFCD